MPYLNVPRITGTCPKCGGTTYVSLGRMREVCLVDGCTWRRDIPPTTDGAKVNTLELIAKAVEERLRKMSGDCGKAVIRLEEQVQKLKGENYRLRAVVELVEQHISWCQNEGRCPICHDPLILQALKDLHEWETDSNGLDVLGDNSWSKFIRAAGYIRNLEAVAEAAQEFLDTISLAERTGANVNMPPVQWQALYKLREMLAVLYESPGLDAEP